MPEITRDEQFAIEGLRGPRDSKISMKQRFYPETSFGGFSGSDGTIAFYSRVNALLGPEMTIADVGCGRGGQSEDTIPFRRALRTMRGKVKRVIGLDVDPVGAENEFVDDFVLLHPQSKWPIGDHSLDLIFADFVVEHIETPDEFFKECARVLRPGGYICIRTPNKWSYPSLMAQLLPNHLHSSILKRVTPNRNEEDVFPTLYRCNTAKQLRHALKRAGFDSVVYGHDAEPGYLSFSSIAYRIGVWHQRHAPGPLKVTLLAFGRKVT